MVISRKYIQRRAGIPRSLAALAACALIAGCGSGGGGSSTPTASSSAPVTPVLGSGGVQDTGGSGGSGGAAAGTVGHGNSTGSFTSSKTGSFSHTSQGTYATSSVGQVGKTSQGSILSPGQQKQAQSQTSTPSHSTSTPATPPPVTHTPPKSSSSGSTQKPPATTNQKPTVLVVTRTRTKTKTRIKYRTVYRNRTQTITKTVVKTQNPNVPSGAFLPSKHPELAQQSFTDTGGNLGCQIGAGGVRCGIVHRTWAAPAQPNTCRANWGDTIALASKGLPQFACGGSNPVDPAAQVIPPGWDDKVGNVICQVRSFGVDCFDVKTMSGFLISRTGYTLY